MLAQLDNNYAFPFKRSHKVTNLLCDVFLCLNLPETLETP